MVFRLYMAYKVNYITCIYDSQRDILLVLERLLVMVAGTGLGIQAGLWDWSQAGWDCSMVLLLTPT